MHKKLWFLSYYYAQKTPLNAHNDVYDGARDLSFDLGLPLFPYIGRLIAYVFVLASCNSILLYARSGGSGETARIISLV